LAIKFINFERFIIDLKLAMSKCEYRKALEDLIEKEDKFYDLSFFWKIRELKIRCMQKILNKKIYKSNAPLNQKIKSIDNWNHKIENEIENWIVSLNSLKISENNSSYEEEIEILIHVILEDMYLNAQYKYHNKQFSEMIAILGIAEKIIKNIWSFCKSVKLIHTCQKIDLFISSLYISDNDLPSAVQYQERVFILIFRELFLRVDNQEKIYYENCSNGIQHCLNKLILNLIKVFYQRGNCESRQGNLLLGTECYKQANYFLNTYLKFKVPELNQFLFDVDKRAKQYHLLIVKIIERYNYHKYLLKFKKLGKLNNYEEHDLIKHGIISLINSEKKEKNKKQKIVSVDKDEEFQGMLKKLKYQEFEFLEDEKKSNKLKQIMSTINLLNNFSSEKFRDILKDMSNLKLDNMDADLMEKIQKRLNEVRVEHYITEFEKNYENKKNKDRFIETHHLKAELEQYFIKESNADNSNTLMNNFNKINFDKSLKYSNHIILNTEKLLSDKITEASSNLNKTKSNSNINTDWKKSSKILDTNQSIKSRPISNYDKVKKDPSRKIKKYEHDEYIFSSNYQSKIKGINDFMKRETDFQKQLLQLKKYEKLPMEIKDIKDIDIIELKSEAKNFFERTFSSCKSGFILNKKQPKKSKTKKEIEKNQFMKKKEKLEIALIKSCDSKVYSILDKIKKIEEKNENYIREEFLNIEKSKILSNEEIYKVNKKFTQKVEKELNFLEKKEGACKKIIEKDNQILKNYLEKKGKFNKTIFTEDSIIPTDSNFTSRPMTSKNKILRINTENSNLNFNTNFYLKESAKTKNSETHLMPNVLNSKNKINKDFCLDQFVGCGKLKYKEDSNFSSSKKITINLLDK
jgi:hypothetical protein